MKNTSKCFEIKHVKDIKIFLEKKKIKGGKRPKSYQNFSEEQKKKKSASTMVNVIRIFVKKKRKKS